MHLSTVEVIRVN